MTPPALSVQLYSVNAPLTADLEGTLAQVAAAGFTNVEAFFFVERAAELRAAFDAAGLRAPTGHASFLSDSLTVGDQVIELPSLETVFAAAKTLGVDVLIDPFVAPERWASVEEITATAERINGVARQAAAHGLRIGYHNHAHEFAHSFDGVSGYEVFAGLLDHAVLLEVDVFWAAVAGEDVPALLRRLGDRVVAIHAKDGILPEPGTRAVDARIEPEKLNQRPAGEGDVPLAEILAAAPSAEYAIVEFDHYDGDIFEGIAASARHLETLGVK
ncbi:sugar phosphate isomerase/epimerase [Agromyces atrinae]|uniref:sugar phosphate isomerase/epimerase family protein n=1 Tax=Agromyces atrinae TaxID=592376 RepID=UPI001F5797A1|nr:sugar phosphate isomerase/epimerase [Agromyces atrinae]MCI2957470.1 sugar phosphate isomerase/epimerase [Agromyces atrinae]